MAARLPFNTGLLRLQNIHHLAEPSCVIIRGDTHDKDASLIPIVRNQREAKQSAASQLLFLDKMRLIWDLTPNGCNSQYQKTFLWSPQLCPFRIIVAICFHQKALLDTIGVLSLIVLRLIKPRLKVIKMQHWMLKSHTQPQIPGLRKFDGSVILFCKPVSYFGLSSKLASSSKQAECCFTKWCPVISLSPTVSSSVTRSSLLSSYCWSASRFTWRLWNIRTSPVKIPQIWKDNQKKNES